MRPEKIPSKIFLDGGDATETKAVIDRLGFLDGQTTNPTLIAKNPAAKSRIASGVIFTEREVYDFYKEVVNEMSVLLPGGSISIEVYVDANTSFDEMYAQSKDMYQWIPNAHIKFPITRGGLEAAERGVAEGMRVNMTLCFSQAQAAAVHHATKGAKKGRVFVSPFVGRLDDIGENGMDLIKNIMHMYRECDSSVEVLTASVRTLEHFLCALALKSDIITAPANVLYAWADAGLPVPRSDFVYDTAGLSPIPYQTLSLDGDWQKFDIGHPLTDKGIQRFADDWNALII